MHIQPAALEEWMRCHYHTTMIDIGSSGVENLAFGELRRLIGVEQAELDALVLHDSTSYGGVGVRTAIAERWADGDPSGVMVTHGSSEAIYLSMTTLLEPDSELIVVHPGYHSLSSIALSLGCSLRYWPLDPAVGFHADPDVLRRLLTPRTRMIVVNFPHNPTGATLSSEEQQAVIDAAADANAYLVWDTALAELTYDGWPRLTDATRLYERSISVGTFSKAFGLPGLRFGWCLGPSAVLARYVHLRDRMTLHLSPLVELIAERVVRNADRILESRLAQARANRELLAAWAAGNEQFVEFVPAMGGVTAFPRVRGVAETNQLCLDLALCDRVLLVPGRCFDFPDRVRLGFGGPTADLVEGLVRTTRRLAEACRVRTAPAADRSPPWRFPEQ